MQPLADCRLYAFIDTAYLNGRAPEELARQLGDGGADVVQLRAKNLGAEEVRRLADRLAPLVARTGTWFVVNDHLDVAIQCGAPICHLGQEDFFEAGHRHVDELPGRTSVSGIAPVQIGLSSHAPEQAERAVQAGAVYIAVGPVFATPTKPGRPPVTLEYVRWAAAHVTIPWFAIGGIHLGNLDEILAAGAQRICVVSALLNAPNVPQACREFRRRLGCA